jgi:hypothetical protein
MLPTLRAYSAVSLDPVVLFVRLFFISRHAWMLSESLSFGTAAAHQSNCGCISLLVAVPLMTLHCTAT